MPAAWGTQRARVLDYMAKHPSARAIEIARVLGLESGYVRATLARQRRARREGGHDERFDALRALVAELRGRLSNLTERQSHDVGMWMLKALWLGEGEPLSQVFEPVDYGQLSPNRPPLSLVK